MSKLFVWDLHGTLEQGNEKAVIEISNLILEKHQYDIRFDETHALQLYGKKWYEYFEHLLPGEPHEKHLQMQSDSFELSDNSLELIAKHMKPSRNALGVLSAIKEKHEQILISNTVPSAFQLFIPALGMQPFFNTTNAFAVNGHNKEAKRVKQDVLAEYLAVRHYDEIIVIGDAESDMELAEAFGAKSYLYAHESTPFRSEKGHYKINDLQELLQEVDK